MMNREEFERALRLLYVWQYKDGTSFTCNLYSLFMKADENNRSKLANAFPCEYMAWQTWYHSEDPEKMFERYGIGNFEKKGAEDGKEDSLLR